MRQPHFVRWATRFRWQWKVFIPIITVLALCLLAIRRVLLSEENLNGKWILIGATFFSVLLCLVLLAILLVLIERPMKELMDTIGRVRRGDLTARVTFAKREDDVGQLGRQFNEMIEQLDHNRKEIEELHTREMARAEHLATLGELAAGLAHEIRNPLAGIAGVVEIMGKELPATSPSRGVIGEVHREILHIQAILNDLLSYARPRPPNIHPANLSATIEQAVLLGRQQVLTKPIQIVFESNPSMVLVEHDPVLIQQVVLNLVLNGIQAICGEGYVRIGLQDEPGFVVIQVADTGQGISAEALPKIFKPFFTTRTGGTGLGLSLANSIVQSHAGRIEVSSTLGKGTRFRIWLPCSARRQPSESFRLGGRADNGLQKDFNR
jgi:two-component system, NtrC family, sensor kinase